MRLHYLIFLWSLFCFDIGYCSDQNLDPTAIEKIKDTIQFNETLRALQNAINSSDNLQVDLDLIENMIALAQKMRYQKGLGGSYVLKGDLYKANKKFPEAIRSYEQAEQVLKKINALGSLAQLYNHRSILEYQRGHVEKSIDYLLEAKMYSEKLADSSGLAVIYNNLGGVYAELDDLDQSSVCYQKAITIRKNTGELKGVGTVMNNLSYIYLIQGKPDKAAQLLPEALAINKKDSSLNAIGHTYSIFGELALSRKNFINAKKYYDTTLTIANKTTFELLKLEAKQQIGLTSIYLNDYNNAETLLAATRKRLEEIDGIQLLLKNYMYTSKLDSARGRYESALEWQKKYQEISDKRMAKLSSKKMERAEARYLAELKNMKLIEKQKKKERTSRTELYKYRLFTLITVIAVALFSVFMYFLVKARKERKMLISDLDASNQVKNKLFSIISHDLKNEISGLDNSLKLLNDNTISQEEFYEIVPLLANRTQQTSYMLHNLLNWSKSQMNELKPSPIHFDFYEVANTKFDLFKPKAELKGIKLINRAENTVLFADKDMIGIVTQNLIANAIKFCNSGDSISLFSEEEGSFYKIHFTDTGIGIKPDNLKRLFGNETFTTRGTKNEAGTGLGLRICKELVELNQGTITVTSKFGKGTTFSIRLPKEQLS